MNLEFAMQLAAIEAAKYASSLGHAPGHIEYSVRYNGFHAGYMKNCAETAALRAIVRRYETGKVSSEPVEEVSDSLDDLI